MGRSQWQRQNFCTPEEGEAKASAHPWKDQTATNSERNQEMIRSKLGLLGLCAVVFGAMAFSTASAQAEANSHFWILNSSGTKIDAGTLNASINLKKDSSVYVLHSEILKIKVLFLCTEL